jgi:cytochrome c biogenesis protein CcdA
MAQPLHLGLALIAGSLSTLQPCVLPLIPIVLGGSLNQNRFAPIYIGMGMVIFYTLIGALTGFVEPLLGFELEQFHLIGAWLMVLAGLILLAPHFFGQNGGFYSVLMNKLNVVSGQLSFDSPLACLLLGAILSLIWAPCAGPMLASALTLLANGMDPSASDSMSGTLEGATLLGLYGIGAALPLIVLAYITRAAFARYRPVLLHAQGVATKILGSLFLALGLLSVSGLMKVIEVYLLGVIPESWLGFVNSI